MAYARRKKVTRVIFVNKMNEGYVNYEKLLLELKQKFGKKVTPFCIPRRKRKFKGFVNVVDL